MFGLWGKHSSGLKKAVMMAHPIIWDPIIVIIMVAFITQAIFVMIFLARVGKVGTVILNRTQRNKGYRGSPHYVSMQVGDSGLVYVC